MAKYVLHPRSFIMLASRQTFRISGKDIMEKHGFRPEDCIIFSPGIEVPGDAKHIQVTSHDLPQYFPDEFEQLVKPPQKEGDFYGFDD